jgi:hypothetical protein
VAFRQIRRQINARLVVNGFFQIQEQDYDKTFAQVVPVDSLRLLVSIITSNGFVPQQLDVTAAFLYGELKDTIYMHLLEGYSDSNKIAHLKRYIY